MSLRADYDLQLDVRETLDAVGEILHRIPGSRASLDAATAPPVSRVFSQRIKLVAGYKFITFDILPGPTVHGVATLMGWTGLRLVLVALAAPAANTAPIIVNDDVFPNPTADEISLAPGDRALIRYGAGNMPQITGVGQDITLTSTDADAELDVIMVAG